MIVLPDSLACFVLADSIPLSFMSMLTSLVSELLTSYPAASKALVASALD